MPLGARPHSWRELWSRLSHALQGGMRQRLTRSGFFFSLITAFVAAAAFMTANNLLFLLLSVLIAAMLISGFISRL